jgi:cysteine synthase A
MSQNSLTPAVKFRSSGHGKIYNNIVETIGDTPLVRLNTLAQEAKCVGNIFAKLEFFNPLASIKDRLAVGMIEDAEASGMLHSDTLLVEPTSGNTGIALAFIAAQRGYRIILTLDLSPNIVNMVDLPVINGGDEVDAEAEAFAA